MIRHLPQRSLRQGSGLLKRWLPVRLAVTASATLHPYGWNAGR